MAEAVFAAASEGDVYAVAAWLDESGGVDDACALLIAAACYGQEAMVRMLLQHGASVNLQDSFGWTALTHAAAHGRTTIVQALLDAKADASLQSASGKTALMWAEHHGQTAAAQLLRQHAERQAAVEEAAVMHAAATAKLNLSGRRVRTFDLESKP